MLLFATACAGVFLSLFNWERRDAAIRRDANEELQDHLYSWGPEEYQWPWYTGWLHRHLGDELPDTPGFVVFSNDAYIDDTTLKNIVIFEELHQVLLGGEIRISEAGLHQLTTLHNLDELDLADADVSVDAVATLRDAMPRCQIIWSGDDGHGSEHD